MGSVVIGPVDLTSKFNDKWIRCTSHCWPGDPLAFSVVTKLKTLMIGVDQLQVDGVGKDQSQLARLGHLTPARLSQFMGLLNLSPEIPERILFLPRVEKKRNRVTERDHRRCYQNRRQSVTISYHRQAGGWRARWELLGLS